MAKIFFKLICYLWNSGRVCDCCHDFIDELHGDVPHHPGALVFLMGERL